MSNRRKPRPHDLLRLHGGVHVTDAPPWARIALAQTPWVVVRRAVAPEGSIAVGVRGPARSQRWATTIHRCAATQVMTPESLCDVRPAAPADRPALRALTDLRSALDETGLMWGPAGSVGFELCTGAATVTATSDLDLVIRAGNVNPSVIHRLSVLHGLLSSACSRVDCQVETPLGAVALAELATEPPQLLVRDFTGPRLVSTAHLVR
ncbi:malonate decarboxylase holo-ACP synthase [Mycobacterium sp. URHB0021]